MGSSCQPGSLNLGACTAPAPPPADIHESVQPRPSQRRTLVGSSGSGYQPGTAPSINAVMAPIIAKAGAARDRFGRMTRNTCGPAVATPPHLCVASGVMASQAASVGQ